MVAAAGFVAVVMLSAETPLAQVASGPMTYPVNGRQYVCVSPGNNLFVYALRP